MTRPMRSRDRAVLLLAVLALVTGTACTWSLDVHVLLSDDPLALDLYPGVDLDYDLPPPTAAAAPTLPFAVPTPVVAVCQGEIAASGSVNVRSGPGTWYAVVNGVLPGDVVEVRARNLNSSWYRVRLDVARGPAEGWIAASLVRLDGCAVDDLPEG